MEQNSIADTSAEQLPAAQQADTAEAVAEETPARPRRRASRRVTAVAGEVVVAANAEAVTLPAAADTPADPEPEAAPKKRVSRARKKAEAAPSANDAESANNPETDADPTEVSEKPRKAPARRKRQLAADKDTAAGSADAPSQQVETGGESEASSPEETATQNAGSQSARSTRKRAKKQSADSLSDTLATEASSEQSAEAGNEQSTASSEDSAANEKADSVNGSRNGTNGDGQSRPTRTRQRERKRRGSSDADEPELTEEDVLLPIAGILDVLDNYAFVRTSGYLPGTGDVYVSLGQVKKYGMRKGDAVVGAIRQPREGEGSGRQRYNAIVKVDTINSKPVDEPQERPEFASFTAINPSDRIRLETDASALGTRVIDLFAPIAKGQRGLVIGPRESGKSTVLQHLAHAIAKNQPDAHLMLVLLDARPEEVTTLTRTVNGEVIASTFDRPAEDHVTIAELAIERAKRLVELEHDVVVLIDSLTSLARAYNLMAPAAARVPAGSLDSAAVFPVKRVLSAARNIENGGSLTVIGTLSAQPGVGFDEALLGELDGVSNMQLRLSAEAADRRVFPAVDLRRSSTRNEALLTSEAEARVMNQLRRTQQDELVALEELLAKLGDTSSNVEFLAITQRAQASA